MNKVLNLDVSKNPTFTEIIYGRVGDSQMQKVTVNITDNDQQLDLTGFVITFEGTLNGEQIKVFDSDNVSMDTTSLKQGSFSYTFPSSAFSQAGKYSRAYFSIAKDGKRNTTGDFKIFVDENADIDAEEAKTVITEYNKLVTELNDLQKTNIDSLNKDIASVKSEIDKLQSAIDEYEASVKSSSETAIKKVTNAQDTAIATIESTKTQAIQTVDATKNNAIETMNNGRDTAITSINVTKDNAVKAINDSKNEAIVAVDDAVNKLNDVDVYSKNESDALYAEKDKTYTKEEVQSLIASIKTDPPSWKAISYQSGFATGDEQPCMYRVIQSLDGVKRVQLKGAVQRTSGSFTDGNTTYPLLLPEEARPQVNQVTLAADDMTSNSKCRVIVLPNGNIQTKTKSGSTAYIYITMEYPIL